MSPSNIPSLFCVWSNEESCDYINITVSWQYISGIYHEERCYRNIALCTNGLNASPFIRTVFCSSSTLAVESSGPLRITAGYTTTFSFRWLQLFFVSFYWIIWQGQKQEILVRPFLRWVNQGTGRSTHDFPHNMNECSGCFHSFAFLEAPLHFMITKIRSS